MDDQQVKFNVFNALKYPDDFHSCQMIEEITEEKASIINTCAENETLLDELDEGRKAEINIISNTSFERLDLGNRTTEKSRP